MAESMFVLEENVFVKTILSSYNVLVHILLGMIVGISLLFAVKLDYNATSVPEDIILLHILLCVPGYTLIMTQSIMSMTHYNTWSSSLSIANKRRVHWILQVIGSGFGLTGSIIIMVYKDVNFNTLHGQFGLVTLIFTIISMINGVTSLLSHRLRRFIPPILSKITHIVLGIVAYASASACLCYAFNKTMFKLWTSDSVALGVISITGIFTLMVLINPLVNLCKKFIKLIKTRLEK
ncbi:transmembrane reductase CYB561D2-like [Anticarsia gemmatalis]|uniref:transmembrane reductase CYB561D2-like n=1 Tax=Anticarsia gemmatalis TaxID=129554 RepID=UPI003F76F005